MDSFTKIESSNDPNHVIRLLISPTTNRLTAEALLAQNESVEDVQRKTSASYVHGRETVARQVRDSLGHMPQTPEDQKAVAKLTDLIRKKKLQVRVYAKERLHAKAYIFELDNPQLPRMSIVGSSNLSMSGIREHTELNLRTNVDNDSEKLLEWFERHWEESEEFTEEIADIMGGSWVGQRTPKDVYYKAVLHEHGTLDDIEVDDIGTLKLFDFQKMAVSYAIQRINDYGGVIIADVVGTGKSYIGGMVLKYLKEKNRSKPLIICPPHLIDMWEDYMEKFDVHAEVISRYKIGMEGNILRRYTNCDVVLVDESHNFRNKSNAYDALYSFMEQQPDDSCIIMLTATPISNSVNDLKNQLKLFPADRISNVQPLGNTTLDEYFKGTEQDHQLTLEGEAKIRELLRHILIRRTRKQIQDNFAKKDGDRYYLESEAGRKYFPIRSLDNPREYDVDRVYQNSFEIMQGYIKDLRLARYSPGLYIREEYKKTTHPKYKKYNDLAARMMSLVGIVRTVLLKRMESSIAAFASSVENYAKGSCKFMDFLKKGVVPIGKDYQDAIYKSLMYDDDRYDSGDDLGPPDYDIDAFDVASWKADISHDISMFNNIRRLLPDRKDFVKHDDKLHTLLDILKERNNQKVLLFTESLVTAQYIHGYIRGELPDAKTAQIDSKKSAREKNDVIRRFDPVNNSADIPPERQLDILVSTDVLSEGVNLQAGRAVINYDFHWNPVRLIQRVGRIDRIGSEHDIVDVVNFLPTTKVESQLHLQERVANKIETIRRIIGHDQKILEESEAIDKDAVMDIYSGNEEVLDEASDGILDIIQTAAELDADRIRGDEALREKIESLPLGIRSAAGAGDVLVACEADERVILGDDIIVEKTFRRYYRATPESITRMTASAFLKQMGNNAVDVSVPIPSGQTAMLDKTWRQFARDMKNEQARKQTVKIQVYFERKLVSLVEDPVIGRRAKSLIPKIKKMIVTNRQPYRNLNELRKKIDRNGMDGAEMIGHLESIYKKSYEYRKEISRPRILYSLVVN